MYHSQITVLRIRISSYNAISNYIFQQKIIATITSMQQQAMSWRNVQELEYDESHNSSISCSLSSSCSNRNIASPAFAYYSRKTITKRYHNKHHYNHNINNKTKYGRCNSSVSTFSINIATIAFSPLLFSVL